MASKARKTTKAETDEPIKSVNKTDSGFDKGRGLRAFSEPMKSEKVASDQKSKVSSEASQKLASDRDSVAKKNETKRQRELNEKVRKILLKKREDIIRETKAEIKKYVTGEKRQLVETALDEGDLSVVDLSEDISLKQLSTHREILQKIDTAFRKLDEGTYGICDECGDEIGVERLMIMPFAVLCRDCQEEREIREKIERENAGL